MDLYHIVMADIIKSRSYDGAELLPAFSRIVRECNEKYADGIISPYTITLGDEFQGVAGSLRSAVETILFLEESLLAITPFFRLRYVVVRGAIDTPINREIAHGMAGPGLVVARELLAKKQRAKARFQLDLPQTERSAEINMLFRLLELLTDRWSVKDYQLIRDLITIEDDASVASKFHKNRSQIWKRRKTLQIEDYGIVKNLIFSAVNAAEGKHG
jgi:hypothetical protein